MPGLPPFSPVRACLWSPASAQTAPSTARPLTLEAIAGDAPLSGPSLVKPEIAPDGTRVTFLRGKDDDRNRLDLWAYDVASGQRRAAGRLADVVLPGEEVLSDEEKARRERQRIAALSAASSNTSGRRTAKSLLFPLGGELYLYDLRKRGKDAVRKLTSGEGFATDPKVSPKGGFVSFMRGRNLWVIDLASGSEHAADARRQRHDRQRRRRVRRRRGDGPPHRLLVGAGRFAPSPSRASTKRRCRCRSATRCIRTAPKSSSSAIRPPATERARAAGRHRAARRARSRSGSTWARTRHLPRARGLARSAAPDLPAPVARPAQAGTGRDRPGRPASSARWSPRPRRPGCRCTTTCASSTDGRFLWSSERSGYEHLYVHRRRRAALRALTSGDWPVDALLAVDEAAGLRLLRAGKDSPLDAQVYRVPLAGGEPSSACRRADGMHARQLRRQRQRLRRQLVEPDHAAADRRCSADDGTPHRRRWSTTTRPTRRTRTRRYRAAQRPIEFGTLHRRRRRRRCTTA